VLLFRIAFSGHGNCSLAQKKTNGTNGLTSIRIFLSKELNMKRYLKGFVLMLISFTGISINGYSQPTYKIEATKDVDMKLLGTSTLHNWEMEATEVPGEAQFVFKPHAQ